QPTALIKSTLRAATEEVPARSERTAPPPAVAVAHRGTGRLTPRRSTEVQGGAVPSISPSTGVLGRNAWRRLSTTSDLTIRFSISQMAAARACLLLWFAALATTAGAGTFCRGRTMPCFAGLSLPVGSKLGSVVPGVAQRCKRRGVGRYLCSAAARPPLASVEAVTAQERATLLVQACITPDVVERLDRTGLAVVEDALTQEMAAAVLVGAQRFLPPYPSQRRAAQLPP
ncbi:hypothetical protein T484DRAFT_3532927, partial [Baffinella frigidus]